MDERERLLKAIEREKKIKSDHYEGVAIQERRIAELEAELAALPPPPVRLRAADNGCIFAGTAEGSDYFARVFAHDCERAGIDHKELTEYLLRFGQPDPNAEALKAADALAEAVAKWPHAPLSLSAFRAAYRKAREVRA